MAALTPVPKIQFFDANGHPLAGGKLYSYSAGTTTPLVTYTDQAGTSANTNPVILDSRGEASVWLGTGPYKLRLTTATDVDIWTVDDIYSEGALSMQELLSSAGSSLVGFIQSGTGATYRTVQSKLRDTVSVKDFGAVGDGVVDDRNAINLALAYLESIGGGTLHFPFGTYFISDTIGNQTSPTVKISLQLIGDPGTVINCNPAVYSNGAVVLQYAWIDTAIVKNLIVQCNTKTARGITIYATGANPIRIAQVDACQVYNVHAVNSAGVTSNLHAISITSTAWGYDASITNCVVESVTRTKTGLACQAIIVAGMQNSLVSNNSVKTVRHSGSVGDKQDADGIVVFHKQNGSGNYEKSTATISNNTIIDCEGRFVKLQTNGSAVVQNNLMVISSAIELINDWVGVDSQVGDVSIIDNTVRIGTGWSGGVSAVMFQPQPPLLANQDYSNEGFFQRINRNNVEVRQQMAYFCVPAMPVAGVTANHYVEIADNFVNYPLGRAAASPNSAFSHFIYLSSGPTPANTNGTVTWKINGNQVTTYNFISITYTLGNYTDKWFMFVYDNYKASFGGDTRLVFAGDPYTNSCMIRDNQMGPGPGRIDWPLDLSKIYDGSDFYVGGQTLTNAPAAYSFSRVYKKGGVLGVQRDTQYYISSNTGAVWTALV